MSKYPQATWNNWVEVAVWKNGHVDEEQKLKPIRKTGKIQYLAGPFRNFHNTRNTPHDLNAKYLKMAFLYPDDAVIHVDTHESIIEKLQQVRAQYDLKLKSE